MPSAPPRRIWLLASSRHPEIAGHGPFGCHLTGRDLGLRLGAVEQGEPPASRETARLVGASCHQPADLAAAERIGADCAVYGPVLPTASHPGAAGIGWAGLQAAIALTPVPVFALGGVGPADLDQAMRAGAHGIAMQRAAWR